MLLYRAVTYLPTIPLGALACLVWRHAPALISAGPPGAAPAPGEITQPARFRPTEDVLPRAGGAT